MPVKWTKLALDRLADLYVAAPDSSAKDAIWQCVERINARLDGNAQFLGESRGSTLRRVWFHHPLVVGFDLPSGGGVSVSHVAGLRPCHGGRSENED